MRKINAASGNLFTDSWSWQSFVSFCDVLNCLFPLDVHNEIQLLSRFFCYSWLVCLLGFWLRIVPQSNFRWYHFHFSPCLNKHKKVEKSQVILALLDGFQELHLDWRVSLRNCCIWCLGFFSFMKVSWHFMKTSIVHAAILCRFLRFETMTWPSIRFD